jgi:putative nucleotidyltransferase with HDIG domain
MRLSIRKQIVGPFVVLVLFVGVVGTAVVTYQFSSGVSSQFDAGLVRTSVRANDRMAQLEASRLELLRAAANTVGVSSAAVGGDAASMQRLLIPVLGNAEPANLTVRVLNRAGHQFLVLQRTADSAFPHRVASPDNPPDQPAIRDVLAGRTDAMGDKYVVLVSEPAGQVLYWLGPIRDSTQAVVGEILVAEPLSDVAAQVRKAQAEDLLLYDSSGRLLSSSIAGSQDLTADVRQAVTPDHPARIFRTVNGQQYGLLVNDWTMRSRPLGYLAIGLNADVLDSSLAQLRWFLVVLFAAAALLALMIGIALSSRITRPIQQLVGAMKTVSARNLHHRAPPGPANEIGFLTETFNAMTATLEAKTRELEDSAFSSLEALARAIDARDPYTFEHSARVTAISLEIAEALGLPADERKALQRGALLHDIGKIGVEDRILAKAGQLTDEEWEQIRQHPLIGYEMLKDVPFLSRSLPGIRHHHERWDGGGYPDKLKGDVIPLQVRIVAVADAFDAMTSDRPYRKSFSFEFAAKTVMSFAGTQFDPEVAKAFDSRKLAIIGLLKEMGKSPVPRSSEVQWLERAG